MSEVRPYYLIGQRQLNLIEENVRIALASLVRRWWPTDEVTQSVKISNFYSAEHLQNQPANYFAEDDKCWMAMFCAEGTSLALAEHWLGCKGTGDSELIKTLMRRFFADVFGVFTQRSKIPALHYSVPWSRLPNDMMRPGAGTLLLDLTVSSIELKLLLSVAIFPDVTEPPVVRVPKKLTPCTVALGASLVRISAALPLAQIPLTDIVTLAEGDFLNLGHDLSGRVQVQGEDIQLSLSATVGRNQKHKAVRLTAIGNEKTT